MNGWDLEPGQGCKRSRAHLAQQHGSLPSFLSDNSCQHPQESPGAEVTWADHTSPVIFVYLPASLSRCRFHRECIWFPLLDLPLPIPHSLPPPPGHPHLCMGSFGLSSTSRGAGLPLTQPAPHQPCPAETASCGWCTPASPSAGQGQPARNHTPTCTWGLAAAWWRRQRGQAERLLGRKKHTPGRHQVQPQRPGAGMSEGGAVRNLAREEATSSLVLTPSIVYRSV